MSAPPLEGIRVVSLAINLPGPAAAARLRQLGAEVVKVEPPSGDPLAFGVPDYYARLTEGQQVMTVDLKDDLTPVWSLLETADLLVTSSRPAALARLGLDWKSLHDRAPRLCQVAIVGHPGEQADVAGHDLTYQASAGTLLPPAMPTVLVADLAGAERAVADGLAALLARERTGEGQFREVALSDVADDLAQPVQRRMTGPGGVLGGELASYRIYAAATGFVAVAALEPHFWDRLLSELDLTEGSVDELERVFATRSADEWQTWARERDLPVAAVRQITHGEA